MCVCAEDRYQRHNHDTHEVSPALPPFHESLQRDEMRYLPWKKVGRGGSGKPLDDERGQNNATAANAIACVCPPHYALLQKHRELGDEKSMQK